MKKKMGLGLSKILEHYSITFKGLIESTLLSSNISWVLPVLVTVGVWFLRMKRMARQQPGLMPHGKCKARMPRENEPDIRFTNVTDNDKAQHMLQKMSDYFENPGRFDRTEILKVLLMNIKTEPNIKAENLADMTPGMVCTDLANLVNEAARLAVRHGRVRVGIPEFREAAERILNGCEKKRLTDENERELVTLPKGDTHRAHKHSGL
jgi:ATP-dependent Zn protease